MELIDIEGGYELPSSNLSRVQNEKNFVVSAVPLLSVAGSEEILRSTDNRLSGESSFSRIAIPNRPLR